MKERFSSLYSSFSEWLRFQNKRSQYVKLILKKHKMNPNLTLKELQNTSVDELDISRKRWDSLTDQQKVDRVNGLEVIRRMRDGDSLTEATEEVGLDFDNTKIILNNSLIKYKGRWKAKKRNRLQRSMNIYSNGRIKNIVVTNSIDASLIGEYYNSVQNYLKSGDPSHLKPYRNIVLIDDENKPHRLETSPDRIREIEESKEDSEFFEIYEDG